MNKTRLCRVLTIVLLAVLSLGALGGCAAKLPEGFDEAEVRAAAENVIDLLNQRDANGLPALMTEEMKVVLPWMCKPRFSHCWTERERSGDFT
jgi:hypothetical protein